MWKSIGCCWTDGGYSEGSDVTTASSINKPKRRLTFMRAEARGALVFEEDRMKCSFPLSRRIFAELAKNVSWLLESAKV